LSFTVLTFFTFLPHGAGLLMKSLWFIPSKHLAAVACLLSHFELADVCGFVRVYHVLLPLASIPIAEKWLE